MAVLIKNNITRHLIHKSSLQLYAPEMLIEELQVHYAEIFDSTKLESEEFKILFDSLMENITIVPNVLIENCIAEAFTQIGDEDPKDELFVASYLCLKVDGLWSNDTDFNVVDCPVFSTSDILEMFNLS